MSDIDLNFEVTVTASGPIDQLSPAAQAALRDLIEAARGAAIAVLHGSPAALADSPDHTSNDVEKEFPNALA